MVKMNKFQNENDLEESDKAALGFRATGARGGIFGIRTLAKSPHPPHRTRLQIIDAVIWNPGNVFLNQISQDTLDIDL